MSSRGRSPAPPGQEGSSASRNPSQSSRGPSPARSVGPRDTQTGWKPGTGVDPARLEKREDRGNTRMELPADAYGTSKNIFALRNGRFNTEGRQELVEINQLRMMKFDFQKKIYQYDIALSPDVDKKGVILRKIWKHPTFKDALAKYNYPMWIFDGAKLAWAPSLINGGELRVMVDLDDGRGNGARENKFYVMIRKTTEVHVDKLESYLDHKTDFTSTIQEALNFLDHLIRQYPSESLLAIKRNFYAANRPGRPLLDGGIVEVHKGTYASLRLSHNIAQRGVGLALNVDVANTCFWIGGRTLDSFVVSFLGTQDRRWKNMNVLDIAQEFRPVAHEKGGWSSSDAFKQLRKLRKLKFKIHHANRTDTDKVYTIMDFHFDQGFGKEGANANNVRFDYNGRNVSVAEYYRTKYGAFIRSQNLPLIVAGKNALIPMEFAVVEPMQRYPFKLNPDQTAAMIKIAVTRPAQRKTDIMAGINALRISQDPYLKHYGIQFDTQFSKTEAKILPPPQVQFSQGAADPKFSGRWDLRGKKFYKKNTMVLRDWAFLVMDDSVNTVQLQQFSKTFKGTFLQHGGACDKDPLLLEPPGQIKTNIAQTLHWAHEQILRTNKRYTQLIFVVVRHKNSPHYERLKKSADCRFGILTQVINSSAVVANNGQYHSNVCMKVNAKLGGVTSRTMPPWKGRDPTYFPKDRPTMIIGVDISHAAPGGNAPSVAAMTMSIDRDGTKYAALAETNGYRTEILTENNVDFLFGKLTGLWKVGHENALPKHIIYFRDGVAEGQFEHVLKQEIEGIKAKLRRDGVKQMPKFTVIVATKRHHVRFFPQSGKADKNGNALPGTLVEKEVTHPFMWDFYLCSHVAIQGTARPVHYHILLDEMNVPVNDIQKMIYYQCYSYARSTTPVSLHPAVYYAHLAGSRARCHENVAVSDGFRSGGKGHEMIRDRIAKGEEIEQPEKGQVSPPLLDLGGKAANEASTPEKEQRRFFTSTMWYI